MINIDALKNKGEAAPIVATAKPSETLIACTIKLTEAEHRRLKICLAIEGKSLQEFGREALLNTMDKLGR
jgi:hypothetical protein